MIAWAAQIHVRPISNEVKLSSVLTCTDSTNALLSFNMHIQIQLSLRLCIKLQLTEDLRHQFERPPSEQQYAETVSSDVYADPTDEELKDIVRACGKLWNLDVNRLTLGQDYEIDCGEGKKMYQKEDMGENALFEHLDPMVFRRPTYARSIALPNNNSADMNEPERRTRQEEQEEIAFIEEISQTAPIQFFFHETSGHGSSFTSF
ncbi:hypothetical protein R1flu_015689 [Riccia fluitans]|uniref:EndoU domain-containing protein n=1 Tax=Riccia fluitans TaxID=41844 RepID=A0ABD1YJV6_9MARC